MAELSDVKINCENESFIFGMSEARVWAQLVTTYYVRSKSLRLRCLKLCYAHSLRFGYDLAFHIDQQASNAGVSGDCCRSCFI